MAGKHKSMLGCSSTAPENSARRRSVNTSWRTGNFIHHSFTFQSIKIKISSTYGSNRHSATRLAICQDVYGDIHFGQGARKGRGRTNFQFGNINIHGEIHRMSRWQKANFPRDLKISWSISKKNLRVSNVGSRVSQRWSWTILLYIEMRK